jgi:hypothetical protein
MLIGVHFKNISALTPDTSLPLSQAIFLSLSAATALHFVFFLLYAQPARLKQFPTVEIHKSIFGCTWLGIKLCHKLYQI